MGNQVTGQVNVQAWIALAGTEPTLTFQFASSEVFSGRPKTHTRDCDGVAGNGTHFFRGAFRRSSATSFADFSGPGAKIHVRSNGCCALRQVTRTCATGRSLPGLCDPKAHHGVRKPRVTKRCPRQTSSCRFRRRDRLRTPMSAKFEHRELDTSICEPNSVEEYDMSWSSHTASFSRRSQARGGPANRDDRLGRLGFTTRTFSCVEWWRDDDLRDRHKSDQTPGPRRLCLPRS